METCEKNHEKITWEDCYGTTPCPSCADEERVIHRDDILAEMGLTVSGLEATMKRWNFGSPELDAHVNALRIKISEWVALREDEDNWPEKSKK